VAYHPSWHLSRGNPPCLAEEKPTSTSSTTTQAVFPVAGQVSIQVLPLTPVHHDSESAPHRDQAILPEMSTPPTTSTSSFQVRVRSHISIGFTVARYTSTAAY
jgi:hypothetical protein